MEIIKLKRKCKCRSCWKPINQKYMVVIMNKNYHLSCIFRWLNRRLENTKRDLKQFSKPKFRKQMILENLE